MYEKSSNCPWYKGPTLFEAIDAAEMPSKPTGKPLRLPIQDVYKISGIGTVPVGKIETGILNTGKTVVFNPSQKSAEVKSIEMHHTMVDKAEPGDNVGFNVRGLVATDIRRGDVAGYSDNEPTYVRRRDLRGTDPAHGHPQGRLHRLHTCVPLPHRTELRFASKSSLRRRTSPGRKPTPTSSRPVTHDRPIPAHQAHGHRTGRG